VEPPEPPSRKGTRSWIPEPTGEKYWFEIVDEVRQRQSRFAAGTSEGKILCLQLLRFDESGMEEMRLGYYIIGKKPRMLGKWVWGQFATMMPMEDFRALMDKAREKGWLE
jgi:hypothetical protein